MMSARMRTFIYFFCFVLFLSSLCCVARASGSMEDFLNGAQGAASESSGNSTLSALGVSVTPSNADVNDPSAPRGLEGSLMSSAKDLDTQANEAAAHSDATGAVRQGLNREATTSAFDEVSEGESDWLDKSDSVDEREVVQGHDAFSSPTTDNLDDALVGMGTLDDLQNNTTAQGDDLDFAQGATHECRAPINVPGNQNCCALNIPHHRIAFTQCNNEERDLASARRAYRVVYIGEYCSHYVRFGVGRKCVEHRQTYCVFPSLLDRIIQEQGRAQLGGISWGTSVNPNCQGFTETQVSEIDWDQLDLSEYEDSLSVNTEVDEGDAYHSVMDLLPAQASAFDDGSFVTVSAPSAQQGDPLQVSPLEGYGPFTVTALLASNWSQYYQDSDQNHDPVSQVVVDWGDGTSAHLTANDLTRQNNIPVYQVTHTYGEPSNQNEIEHITATFYSLSGTHVATATVQNVYDTPSNTVLEGSGGHREITQTTLNRMPDYGDYSADQIPGRPSP